MDFDTAVALQRAGDVAGAAAAYRAVLANAEHAPAMANLGSIERAAGRFAEAERLLRRSIELAPERPVARLNLANLLLAMGRLDEAAAAYSEYVRIDPANREARKDLGCVYLARGQDQVGWALYDERPERQKSAAQRLKYPEWQGEDLTGRRLLVLGEQGFGDLIFAARYLAGLAAAKVTFACPPQLGRLFGQLPVEVVPWLGPIEVAPHDRWALPLSLPRWTAPAAGPYLRGSPRGRGGIGVAWKGNARPDPGRSLPAELGAALLALPGAVSLHPEDSGARDFQDTADIIAGLEAVVSIDTSVAHLAGAMGKRTLVLLQHYPRDWRWRDARPWYPSATLIRQPAPGDWRSVVETVRRLLA